MVSKTVLIVTSDLGFMFWLGRVLANAGYDSLPARDPRAAAALLAEIPARVGLLLIDPATTRAASFIAAMRASGVTHVIGLAAQQSPNLAGAAHGWGNPLVPGDLSGVEWGNASGDLMNGLVSAYFFTASPN